MGATVEQVKITGLRDLQAALRAMDGESQKKLRLVLNKVAQLVVDDAAPRVPLGPGKGGHARNTLKPMSSQREVQVRGGGKRSSYYPWLDFGGTVGRHRSVKRSFLHKGRYIYPAWDRKRDDAIDLLQKSLVDLAQEVGLRVD